MVVHEQRLGDALPLVVAGARPDGIDVAPVALGLRMDRGIAVDLGDGRLEHARADALGGTSMLIAPMTFDLTVFTGLYW